MAVLIKAILLLIAVTLVSLLLRKNAPEQAMLLTMAAVTAVLLAAGSYAGAFRELAELTRTVLDTGGEATGPILKCAAVGVVAKLGANFCRDASQSAAAAAVELLGTLCALSVAMPLILSVLKTVVLLI